MVVDYGSNFRNAAAEQILELPDGSPLVEMISDYQVMREQARVCREFQRGPS